MIKCYIYLTESNANREPKKPQPSPKNPPQNPNRTDKHLSLEEQVPFKNNSNAAANIVLFGKKTNDLDAKKLGRNQGCGFALQD